MNDPVVVDFFCCGGGASVGYERAGLDMYGVDKVKWSGYPFIVRQADAITSLRDLLDGKRLAFSEGYSLSLDEIDAFVGSPPCQVHSTLKSMAGSHHVDLIPPTRELFRASGKPYIIENVPGAPMLDPVILCGSMFGLGAHCYDGRYRQLRRHRQFESNFLLTAPGPCKHDGQEVIGIYGNTGVTGYERSGYNGFASEWREALGIDWLTVKAMSQAIPPAYTEHLGRQLRARITGETV